MLILFLNFVCNSQCILALLTCMVFAVMEHYLEIFIRNLTCWHSIAFRCPDAIYGAEHVSANLFYMYVKKVHHIHAPLHI